MDWVFFNLILKKKFGSCGVGVYFRFWLPRSARRSVFCWVFVLRSASLRIFVNGDSWIWRWVYWDSENRNFVCEVVWVMNFVYSLMLLVEAFVLCFTELNWHLILNLLECYWFEAEHIDWLTWPLISLSIWDFLGRVKIWPLN